MPNSPASRTRPGAGFAAFNLDSTRKTSRNYEIFGPNIFNLGQIAIRFGTPSIPEQGGGNDGRGGRRVIRLE
jgi:hypothetical protein